MAVQVGVVVVVVMVVVVVVMVINVLASCCSDIGGASNGKW